MTRNLEPVFPCRKYILGRKSQLQHPISASQLPFGYKQGSGGYIGRELERATKSRGRSMRQGQYLQSVAKAQNWGLARLRGISA
jgi:hypothetical protein